MQNRYRMLNTVITKSKKIAGKFSLGNITRGYGVISAASGVAFAGIANVAEQADKLTKT